jgi:hypothetical protein
MKHPAIACFQAGLTAAFFSAASFTAALSAQTSILVGPGGLPQISSALAIANPGDTIVVAPGTYGLIQITKASPSGRSPHRP